MARGRKAVLEEPLDGFLLILKVGPRAIGKRKRRGKMGGKGSTSRVSQYRLKRRILEIRNSLGLTLDR